MSAKKELLCKEADLDSVPCNIEGTARQGSSHAGVTVAACGSRARLADAVGALFAPGPIMMCGHVTRAAGGPGAAADARCCERLGRFKLT